MSASPIARRTGSGGIPRYDEPFFAFSGVEDSTPTRPRFGTERPGAVIPELPRKACLPIRAGATCSQPWPSS